MALAQRPPRLHAHVGRDIAAPMLERAWCALRLGMPRLGDVLDHETGPAEAAQQLLPAVQKLQRARLAVQAAGDLRQRALAVIRLDQLVPARPGLHVSLQARGLLVLADVEPAGHRYAGHLAIDG